MKPNYQTKDSVLNDNVLDLYLELKQTKTDTIIDLCSKINEQAF
jgi:hypothetical protein